MIVGCNRGGRDFCKIDRLAPPGLGAPGEGQACLEHTLLLPAGPEDVLADLAPGCDVRGRVGESQLEQSALRRERRAQLVRGVGERQRHRLEGRARPFPPHRASAPTFGCGPVVSFPDASPSAVKRKIV